MQKLVCKRCKHQWEYAGDKHRTSCPKCKTSITILGHPDVYTIEDKPRTTVEFVPEKQSLTNRHVAEVIMPLGMAVQLNKFLLGRLIGVAKANGEDSIKFKVDPHGVLVL